MSEQSLYPWRVMISSTMLDLPSERQTAIQVIRDAHMNPWYAEDPPSEFIGGSNYEFSRRMAQSCDLYLLIIGARYGSHPVGMPAEDLRSVTHLEFDVAREQNPRKIRIFIPDCADDIANSQAQRDFLEQIRHFTNGVSYFIYRWHDLPSLSEKIHLALQQAQESQQIGRDAYMEMMRDQYTTFLNPVTGKAMSYNATVMLKLRAESDPAKKRADLEAQMEETDLGRARRGRERRVDDTQARTWREVLRRRPEEAAKPLIAQATEFLNRFERLAIVGDVGSGKSTLLRRLAHDVTHRYFRRSDASPRIPILVRATNLGRMVLTHPEKSLADIVALVKEAETLNESLKPTIRTVLANAIVRGEVLLLVDGLDEANSDEQEATLSVLSQMGQNRSILASRPTSYRGQLAGWRICDVQRLDPIQRHTLILRTFADMLENDDLPEPSTLERELESRPDLFIWAGNPLLLTLIAAQYSRDRQLSGSRARIYQIAIEDLQHQRVSNEIIGDRRLTQTDLNRLLPVLALKMTETNQHDLTIAEATTMLAPTIAAMFPGSADSVIAKITVEGLTRSGVLQQQATDVWEYVHISFREYLTAVALADLSRAERHDMVRRHCLSAMWQEVFPLLIATLDDTPQMQADAELVILDLIAVDRQYIAVLGGYDPTHTALRLATHCQINRRDWNHGPSKALRALHQAWWPLWQRDNRNATSVMECIELFGSSKYIPDPAPFILDAVPIVANRIVTHYRWSQPSLTVKALTIISLTFLIIAGGGQVILNLAPFHGTALDKITAFVMPFITLCVITLIICLRYFLWRQNISRGHFSMLIDRSRAIPPNTAKQFSLALIKALADPSSNLRQAAAEALGSLGERMSEKGVHALIVALADNDWLVKNAAAEALGTLGARMPESGIQALIFGLTHDAADIRLASARALVALGKYLPDKGIQAIIAASLVEDDSHMRFVLINELSMLGGTFHPEDTQALIAILCDSDEDEHVRQAAAQTLGTLGDKLPMEGIQALIQALTDEKWRVRKAAAVILGSLGENLPEEGIQALIVALGDRYYDTVYQNYPVQEATAQALGALGKHLPEEDIRTLIVVMADEKMRYAAALTLGALGEHLPEEGIQALITALTNVNPEMREGAARAVSALGDRVPDVGVVVLLSLLDDANWRVRQEAARALRASSNRIPDLGIPTLIISLSDKHSMVREAAAQVLGGLGDRITENGISALIAALADTAEGVRWAAAQALSTQGNRVPEAGIQALFNTLNDESASVRETVSQSLGTLGAKVPSRAIQILIAELTAEYPSVRRAAASALNGIASVMTVQDARRIQNRIVTVGRWSSPIMRFISILFDWPILMSTAIAQIFIIWPVVKAWVHWPPIVLNVFGLTAWWQTVLILAGYLIAYYVFGGLRVLLTKESSDARNAAIGAMESFVPRIIDTMKHELVKS